MKKIIFSASMLMLSVFAIPAFASGAKQCQSQKQNCQQAECAEQNCNPEQNCAGPQNCVKNSECAGPQNCVQNADSCCNGKKVVNKDCRKGKGKKDGKQFGQRKRKSDRSNKQNFAARQAALFEGITLSAEQQTKLDALNAQMKADRQKAREEFRAKKEAARAEARSAKSEMNNVGQKVTEGVKIAKADLRKDGKNIKKGGKKFAKMSKSAFQRERKEALNKYHDGIKSILTSQQYAQYENNLKAMKERQQKHDRKDRVHARR